MKYRLAVGLAGLPIFASLGSRTVVIQAPHKIAFASERQGNQRDIYVMNEDGSQVTNLTNHPANDFKPGWSPDGTKIVFTSNRDGKSQIYVMNADGSNPTRLTRNTAIDAAPAWSPDGTKIAFVSNRDGELKVYIMNADGSEQRRLTAARRGGEGTPAWSPDGRRIAYASDRAGWFDIYVVNASGEGETRLTENRYNDAHPSWSPDGSKIAFCSDRDGNFEIYVMNADGTGVTRLTNHPALDCAPTWSPTGAKIAFDSNRDGKFDIYVMNADGTNPTRLTNDPSNDNAASLPFRGGARRAGITGQPHPGEAARGVSARRGDRVWPHSPAVVGAGGQDSDGDESGRGGGGAVRATPQCRDSGVGAGDSAEGEDCGGGGVGRGEWVGFTGLTDPPLLLVQWLRGLGKCRMGPMAVRCLVWRSRLPSTEPVSGHGPRTRMAPGSWRLFSLQTDGPTPMTSSSTERNSRIRSAPV